MKLKKLSGKELVKILVNKFNFIPIRQKGSHLILKSKDGKRGCVVPMHEELKIGTILGILEQAGISKREFLEKSKRKGK